MAINDDLNEMQSAFKKAGPFGKVIVIISALLALSSIASLSEEIIKWKGFILEGITFYHSYFVEPIKKYGAMLGLEYTTSEIHYAVLSSISMSIGVRVLAVGQKVAFNEINKNHNTKKEPNLFIYNATAIIATPAIFIWQGIKTNSSNVLIAVIIFIIYPAFLVLPKIILTKFFPRNFAYHERESFSYIKSYYSVAGAILLIIGIMGAINAAFLK